MIFNVTKREKSTVHFYDDGEDSLAPLNISDELVCWQFLVVVIMSIVVLRLLECGEQTEDNMESL